MWPESHSWPTSALEMFLFISIYGPIWIAYWSICSAWELHGSYCIACWCSLEKPWVVLGVETSQNVQAYHWLLWQHNFLQTYELSNLFASHQFHVKVTTARDLILSWDLSLPLSPVSCGLLHNLPQFHGSCLTTVWDNMPGGAFLSDLHC